MFVGKQFDIVMGVDIHIMLVPTPAGPVPTPIPNPFIGMVLDPFDFIFGKIQVNGIARALAGSGVVATVPHMPIGGMFQNMPPANHGILFMGSLTVSGQDEPVSYNGLPVLTCNDLGIMSPPRIGKKPQAMVLPTSILIVVPKGGINMSPTPPTIAWKVLAMLAVFAALGKLAKVVKRAGVLRKAYEAEVEGLKVVAKEMRNAGKNVEEIARHLSAERRQLGVKYKDMMPKILLEGVYKRNIEKYGDKLGPTIEFLRQKGSTWERIIETSCTPDGADVAIIKAIKILNIEVF